ncbi:hypothetical protein A2U01_0086158, partial [Trifolium medium]|nr:hypothetical protein [Trifolium medium]
HSLWYSKSTEYISFEETKYPERCYVGDGFGFDPLGKIVDSDDQKPVLIQSHRERPEDIHAPPGKGPRRG